MGFEFRNSKNIPRERRPFWEGNEGAGYNLEYGWRLHLYPSQGIKRA